MVSVEVYIDTKEKQDVFDIFRESLEGIHVFRKNMPVGDISISMNGEDIILIERKTSSDFASSINDGRYREQKIRLKQVTNNPESSVIQVIYLIEGLNDRFIPFRGRKSKIPSYDTLFSAMASIVVKDKLYLFRTARLEETVNFIKKVVKKIEDNPDLFKKECKEQEYIETVKITKKDNLTKENCFMMQLSSIPGLSVAMAKEISQTYQNMGQLIRAYDQIEVEKDKVNLLKDIKYGESQRRIGPKVSERVYQYLL